MRLPFAHRPPPLSPTIKKHLMPPSKRATSAFTPRKWHEHRTANLGCSTTLDVFLRFQLSVWYFRSGQPHAFSLLYRVYRGGQASIGWTRWHYSHLRRLQCFYPSNESQLHLFPSSLATHVQCVTSTFFSLFFLGLYKKSCYHSPTNSIRGRSFPFTFRNVFLGPPSRLGFFPSLCI